MEKRCFNCMEILKDGVCPDCGFKATSETDVIVFKERYQKGTVFSKTLDSTVYLAYDNELGKKVLVREFTGDGISEVLQFNKQEELKQRFLSYAKTTATISLCDILPRTIDTFFENDRAYWVTDYFDGKSLKELINSGVKISASSALKITTQLLKGLKTIHNSGAIFGAISPETLYILKNGEVRIFGLGSAFYSFTDNIDFLVEFLNPSYAAPELFNQSAKIGTYCDVYSVAAILYRIITGKIPAIGFLRSGGENLIAPHKINKEIPKNIENALLNALNWQTEKRTLTPDDFLEQLSANKVKRNLSGAILWANVLGFFQGIYDKTASKKVKPPKDKKKDDLNEEKQKIPFLWLWITIPAVILVGLTVTLILLFPATSQKGEDTAQTSSEGEDIWYYGSGVETPTNSSNYVYGGTSSKKPNTPQQSRPQNTTSIDPNAIECPDLAGYSLSQAKTIIETNYLILGNIRYEYSKDYPADYVMAQSLKSGGIVPKGSKINLVVCKGAQSLELPDLSGKEMQKATEQLKNLGFTNIEFNFVFSDDAVGTVTDAAFENEEGATYDSKVIITISGEEAKVENYSNKLAGDVIANNPDFNFVFKTQDGNDLAMSEVNANYTVISQSVAVDTVAYKGMTITLTVG